MMIRFRRMSAATGVLACLIAMGCSSNRIDGGLGDYDYGKIQTAYFDYYSETVYGLEYGLLTIWLSDYEWTCEALQAASENGLGMPASDPADLVVGSVVLTLGQYLGDYEWAPPEEVGEFSVVSDMYDPDNITVDGLFAEFDATFASDDESIYMDDFGTWGTIELKRLDLSSELEGTFEVGLLGGGTMDGRFTVARCPIY